MTGSDANIRSSHNNTAENGVSAAVASVANGRLCFLDDFLIARGGPYYDLQKRLGLLTERALNAGRRAAILVGLAWGVPLVCPSSSLPGMHPPESWLGRAASPTIGLVGGITRAMVAGRSLRCQATHGLAGSTPIASASV